MKVAITGAAGLFGHALVAAFSSRHVVFPLTRADADITDAESVRATLERIRPEVVVHPAGIPDLDIADADPARAYSVNVLGTRHVAESAHAVGAHVVYISTDAVFDGKNTRPYVESDRPSPITVYGRTKLGGEEIVQTQAEYWIFRVPVLFGPGKTNFIEKGLRKLTAGEPYVSRVTRKVVQPTRSMPLTKSWRLSRLAATASSILPIRERALATNSPGAPPNWPDWTRAR